MSIINRRSTLWLATGLLCAVGTTAVAVGPGGSAQAAVPLEAAAVSQGLAAAYQLSAESSVMQVRPVLGVVLPDAVVADFGYSHAEASSTPLSIGIAGPAYVPAVGLLSFLGLPGLPANALPFCSANAPGSPTDVSCVGPGLDAGGGNSFYAGNGEAHARGVIGDPTQTRVNARATSGGASGFGFTYGAAQATSTIEPAQGAWTAIANVAIQDLNIAGIVTIDSIKSFARGTANGDPGSATTERGVEVAGLRVAGTDAVLTTEGVKVADQGSNFQTKALQDQVSAALKQAGISLTLLPPESPAASKDGTKARTSSGGVALQAIVPGLPVGNEIRAVFGRSMLNMSARQIPQAGGPLGTGTGATPADGTGAAALPAASPAGGVDAAGAVPSLAAGSSGGDTALAAGPQQPAGGDAFSRAFPVAFTPGGSCGLICVYALYSVIAFLFPVAYMSRRFLLRG